MGPRFALAFLASTLTMLIAVSVTFEVIGLRSRWDAQADAGSPAVVRTSKDLATEWDRAGVRNAVLVSVSRDLGFEPVSFEASVAPAAEYPIRLGDVGALYSGQVDRTNYLWVAAQRGVFRTVYHVMPSSVLVRRVEQGRAAGFPGIAPDGRSIRPNNDGYLRSVAATFPQIDGPVVLDIEASYFEAGDPVALARDLRASQLDYRLVTVNRSFDDTSTTDATRSRLDVFMKELERPR